MLEFTPQIDKKYILERLSQEEIFEKYLGIPVYIGRRFKSPLRQDKTPTCSLKYIGKVLWMQDWSGHFRGDCFNLVERMYNCNFYRACEIIASDFDLIKKNIRKERVIENDYVNSVTDIRVRWRPFKKEDEKFWGEFGITEPLLNFFKVAPIKEMWVNGSLKYTHRDNDLAYAYYFGPGKFKIYFPNRKELRFRCNTNVLQGYDQLPEKGDIVIITKSMKDIMTLKAMGYYAVAPQSESIIPSEEEIKELKSRFSNVYSFYDFDLAGIRSANKMRKLYDVKPIFLTNGRFGTKNYFSKDVSDLVKKRGIDFAINASTLLQSSSSK